MRSYTYSVLRFTPDIRTGEFINVGIAAYSAANKLALIRCRNTVGRVTKLNHAVNGHGLVRMLKAISKEFNARSSEIAGELEFTKIKNVGDICHMVLPEMTVHCNGQKFVSGNAKPWTPSSTGCTNDLLPMLMRKT